jgi:hypothetical protein
MIRRAGKEYGRKLGNIRARNIVRDEEVLVKIIKFLVVYNIKQFVQF